MSAIGIEVFDRTVQITNIWLNELMDELGIDRHAAWHVLGAVLRPLRDQLPPEMAVHLGAELPILVRGLYYDGWRTPGERAAATNADEFLAKVAAGVATVGVIGPDAAVKAVSGVLGRHVDPGQVSKVRNCLSARIRTLWPETPVTRTASAPKAERAKPSAERVLRTASTGTVWSPAAVGGALPLSRATRIRSLNSGRRYYGTGPDALQQQQCLASVGPVASAGARARHLPGRIQPRVR